MIVSRIKKTLSALLTSVLLVGCQPHFSLVFPTSPPIGQQQLLVTFDAADFDNALAGGSLRSYHAGVEWSVPLELKNYIRELEKDYSLQQQKAWLMESIDQHCVVFTLDDSKNLNEVIEAISRQPLVRTVQAMHQFEVMSSEKSANKLLYNDSHVILQYGGFIDQLNELHQYSRGESVKVGIVDTLLDINHPDLQGQVIHQYQYVAGDNPDEVHGTAIAGIISARANNGRGLVGLAPASQLYVYAACDSANYARARCNSFNILQGLEQAVKDKIDVLNLSIAGPHDALIEQVLNVAIAHGMVVIAAINPRTSTASFPANMDSVIGVGEVNPNRDSIYTEAKEKFGDWLVRSEKMSTLSGGGYQFFYGSSVSTASLSGIAALLRSHSSTQKTFQFVDALARGDCRNQDVYPAVQLNQVLQQSSTCKIPHNFASTKSEYRFIENATSMPGE